MAAFDPRLFERQAEAFLRARSIREWRYLAGLSPSLGLGALYTEDFPLFQADQLLPDLLDTPLEDESARQSLASLAANAYLEGHTAGMAGRAARWVTTARVTLGDTEIPWLELPRLWSNAPDLERRHAHHSAWRGALSGELNPLLQRWQEALAQASELAERRLGTALPTGEPTPNQGASREQAQAALQASAELYVHVVGVYLAQLGLPLDDAWNADLDWAMRAGHFDASLPTGRIMPALVRTLRGLRIELEDQVGLGLDFAERAGKAFGALCVATDVPREVQAGFRPVGGYQDLGNALRALGQAEHGLHTDPGLTVAERWLGDATIPLASGLLFESLVLDATWLRERYELPLSDDLRIVARLQRLRRARVLAATVLHEERLWTEGASAGGLAADFAEAMSAATRSRNFGEEALLPVLGAPWRIRRAAVLLRAELFAAHLEHYLRREFDTEWWRNTRAGRFLVDELWRPGRRFTAEQLLGFMGYGGFDVQLWWSEHAEVLQTV